MNLSCIVVVTQCVFIFAGHNSCDDGIDGIDNKMILGIAAFICVIALLAFVSIGRLWIFHFSNFIRGKTSSERFSRSAMVNTHPDQISLKNCYQMCCNT